MYSIFFSMIEQGIEYAKEELIKIVKPNDKVVIFPWAFPTELNEEKFENEYFKKGEKRYKRYIDSLKKIGLKEDNMIVCNCYKHTKEELIEIINNSDILLLPGGNPEMFFSKVVHQTEILYNIKHYNKIIIGESAGAELQLERYFITAENNFYKYFAFYDGFGIIKNDFYFDVHTRKEKYYLNRLQNIANEKNKKVYGIYDDGYILYDRKNKKIISNANIEIFDIEEAINNE